MESANSYRRRNMAERIRTDNNTFKTSTVSFYKKY